MTAPTVPRVIAIDWSGARSGERNKIWLAEVRDGELVRLESGRSRIEVVDHVGEEAMTACDLIVGLDFAFSLPAWFLRERGLSSADALWALTAAEGESWLGQCEPPFWGRPAKTKPDLPEHLRITDRDATVGGIGAKSVFQIGGAGAVGTGSLRGMPHLARLRAAGFSIWPFHDVQHLVVIEIYPRLLTGPVTKSSHAERERYLSTGFPEIRPEHMTLAASSEDAFDAAVSAVIMARNLDELSGLERAVDATERLEGRIWAPEGSPTTGLGGPSSHAAVTPPEARSSAHQSVSAALAGPLSPTVFGAKARRRWGSR